MDTGMDPSDAVGGVPEEIKARTNVSACWIDAMCLASTTADVAADALRPQRKRSLPRLRSRQLKSWPELRPRQTRAWPRLRRRSLLDRLLSLLAWLPRRLLASAEPPVVHDIAPGVLRGAFPRPGLGALPCSPSSRLSMENRCGGEARVVALIPLPPQPGPETDGGGWMEKKPPWA